MSESKLTVVYFLFWFITINIHKVFTVLRYQVDLYNLSDNFTNHLHNLLHVAKISQQQENHYVINFSRFQHSLSIFVFYHQKFENKNQPLHVSIVRNNETIGKRSFRPRNHTLHYGKFGLYSKSKYCVE